MADNIDCEGNIISPLGNFKKISPVSPTNAVQLPVVSVCSTPLYTSTTVSYCTRTPFTLTAPSCPASVTSVSLADAKSPVLGGVRGYEYVSVADLTMIYNRAVKIKKERELTQKQNEKLRKMLKSCQRKEKSQKQLSVPTAPALVTTSDIATQADNDTTTVSPLTSSWHSLFLQLRAQSSAELQKARDTIATQARQMVDKEKEIKRLTSKVATLTHYNNQAHLALQQNLSSSITGSVFDSTLSDVDPEEGVTPEPAPVLPPREEPPRRDDSNQISQMLDSVDRLAQVYSPPDRYHKPRNVNLSKPRNDVEPDKLMNFEFAALWMNATDATAEEEAEYDRHLERELRPPPIHSPRLKKPAVNWNRLNPGQFKNLPKAEAFPVSSCSPDPEFYLAEEIANDTWRTRSLKWLRSDNRFPFGYLHGFSTNMGIVAVPEMPIHGYRCCEGTGYWMIDAMG